MLILERGVGRERNIDVREKHQLVASCTWPNRGPDLQPRHVSWLGIKSATFQFMGWRSNQLSHTGLGTYLSLNTNQIVLKLAVWFSLRIHVCTPQTTIIDWCSLNVLGWIKRLNGAFKLSFVVWLHFCCNNSVVKLPFGLKLFIPKLRQNDWLFLPVYLNHTRHPKFEL